MHRTSRGKMWAAGITAVVLVCLAASLWRHETNRTSANDQQKTGSGREASRSGVVVVKPQPGGLQRISDQPGSIEAFDYADLYGKVSGFLKNQTVDIGDKVKKGEQLAAIDAPEYQQDVESAKAALVEARAQVTLKEALLKTAQVNVKVAQASIQQSESDLARATAEHKFRQEQYDRIKELFKLKSVEERLVDEKDEQRHAAEAAVASAHASITTAQAGAEAAAAKVDQARAEVEDARAKVSVAEAAVGRAQVFVEYTRIVSPYDGVVTRRNFHEGDFIRGAGQGAGQDILTVARNDRMRVVVQVPERDVPFLHPGDRATIALDARPDKPLQAKVSRVADSEDRTTRSMRTEIDLENPNGELRDGMFLRVTIFLNVKNQGVTIPSTCLVEDPTGNKTSIFIVHEGKAQKKKVNVGRDDGSRVEILDGLAADDQVVLHPGGDLWDGDAVQAEEQAVPDARKQDHQPSQGPSQGPSQNAKK
ncbi:MAG TPA: efflux RND transporter periplasmic adaptor subunit [Planctomycetaceae bacterium]